jgi:phosphotriesterase-related protein
VVRVTSIETLRGPIQLAELGVTLMHEHIFVRDLELEYNYPQPEWNEENMVAAARAGLASLHAKGISTLVDLTVMGLGRDVPLVLRVAADASINVVVATGYYTHTELPKFFQHFGPGKIIDVPDPLEGMFLRDIQEGIADTGVKAGIIKVKSEGAGITPDVERVMVAAARAHKATGVPISTHTDTTVFSGRDQQAIFRKLGVNFERVVIGHSGDTTDLDYLKELMDNGSTIGMDRFGVNARLPEKDRIATVVALCELGYADQMVLSHDAGFYSVFSPPSYRAQRSPEWNLENISDRVLPELKRRGISDEVIHQMMVVNPKRILEPKV